MNLILDFYFELEIELEGDFEEKEQYSVKRKTEISTTALDVQETVFFYDHFINQYSRFLTDPNR